MNKSILIFVLLFNSPCLFSQTTDSISNSDDIIYENVDSVASFPGGKPAWNKFVEKNLNPLVGVENGAKKGTYRVKIRFTVTTDGTLKDFQRVTNYKHGFEEEAIRVLKLSPKWIPARKNGVHVNSSFVQEQVFIIAVM